MVSQPPTGNNARPFRYSTLDRETAQAILAESKTSGNTLFLLSVMLILADDHGDLEQTIPQLGEWMRKTPDTARGIVRSLRATGEIVVKRAGSGRTPTIWHIAAIQDEG